MTWQGNCMERAVVVQQLENRVIAMGKYLLDPTATPLGTDLEKICAQYHVKALRYRRGKKRFISKVAIRGILFL